MSIFNEIKDDIENKKQSENDYVSNQNNQINKNSAKERNPERAAKIISTIAAGTLLVGVGAQAVKHFKDKYNPNPTTERITVVELPTHVNVTQEPTGEVQTTEPIAEVNTANQSQDTTVQNTTEKQTTTRRVTTTTEKQTDAPTTVAPTTEPVTEPAIDPTTEAPTEKPTEKVTKKEKTTVYGGTFHPGEWVEPFIPEF